MELPFMFDHRWSLQEIMDNMQYAEGLVREFLLFRGFKNTLQVFESELSSDISKNFQVEKITDLIFLVYVPKFEADKLVSLITFLRQCFSSSETVLISTLTKMEASILRYYIVHALKCGRQDKVLEFFGPYGNVLLQRGDDWTPWFAIPYLKNPSLDPQFHVHFSKEWLDALILSFKNFLSEIFNDTRIPALLKISTDNNTVKRLKKDIKQLNLKLLQLQASLERKDAQLCQLRSSATSTTEGNIFPRNGLTSDQSTGTSPSDVTKENSQLQYPRETNASDSVTQIKFQVPLQDASNPGNLSVMSTQVESGDYSSYLTKVPHGDGRSRDTVLMCQDDVFSETSREELREEEFPEVKVGFQETFLGHTSPISRCRFSAGGTNIASASVDGTVRIWTYDSSTPTSRNATIYCGAEIMSLDWECKSDRLLPILNVSQAILRISSCL